jgi:hypothetical protein
MPRRNGNGRRKYYNKLSKFKLAKILGIKPKNLTIEKGYVREEPLVAKLS